MRSWFQETIIEHERLPLLVCFAAFIVTFLTTRVITRMIRAGRGPFKNNVSAGGLHVHHAIPGVILLVAGSFTGIAVDLESPWSIIAGLLIGVGTSLVLDEFALILHLEDVYWKDEGRISVEMVSLAVAALGLLIFGVNPFAFETAEDTTLAVAGVGGSSCSSWPASSCASSRASIGRRSSGRSCRSWPPSAPFVWPARTRCGRGAGISPPRRRGPWNAPSTTTPGGGRACTG